ncbi:protein PLASTID MOVEMENT IMPAIRED 1-like [Lolium rigidum]|uniref:protein PLASTID MOVEMENT IMPAIRED 1-like n=1 Tax=Lolium rigidum TaxID=89674 RepID=UPI001F5D28E4|nr:protein PLASTID MOVEMENT IMPAIRED 1-like [Lolium rigidum]
MAGVSGSGLGISDYLDRPNAIHRRTASLAIARSGDDGPRIVDGAGREGRRARSSRLSLSSWLGPRSRPPPHKHADDDEAASADSRSREPTPDRTVTSQPSSAWRSWKPVRALAHIGKRRAGCLFSVEVAAVRGVPASMDGLRLAVAIRKAETRDGAMQTMPARVSRDGSAEFDETLFVKCNLFFTGGPGTGKPLKLEPRRFVVSVVPVEAPDIRLGTYAVDVSELVRDSLQRSNEGRRVRWFDRAYGLAGKAAGGELLLRLGFQLMEDAGLRLYTQAAAGPAGTGKSSSRDVSVSPARARAHSKNSFSISSSGPKLSASDASISPSMRAYRQLLDRLNVDKRADDDDELSTASGAGDGDYASIPEYEVVDKGVETVKEVVHFQAQRDVLRELDSIADQIEAIEALMASGGKKSPRGTGQQPNLDADEEMVTVEFLRKLEAVDDDKYRKLKQPMTPRSREAAAATPPVVPDLGQSLGPAVQTRDGGFLLSMNPFNVPLASRDVPPMLAMQLSRPFVLPSAMAATGFDVLQKMAAAGGPNEVRDKLVSLGGMESLTGKTPEQVGFEGIAEAVIGGRRTEGGASSSAARSVQLVRKFAAAVSEGRRERVATGIWSAGSDPETLEEVLAFSVQKLEAMAVDALMIQADMADEEPPFEVAPAAGDVDVFDALVPCEEWSDTRGVSDGRVTLVAAIQLRDPSRRYEAVGAPMVAVVQSARMLGAAGISGGRFKVRSLHVGGVQTRSSSGVGGSASWRAERQKLTAMQWTVAHGPGRAGKRVQTPPSSQAAKARQQQQQRPDVVWSLSSRVLAGMWLKTVRNPDVKIGSA